MDKTTKDSSDIFVMNTIYPNAASIFIRNKALEEVKNDCYVVLDTNVLLAPYTIGEEDLLEQCRKTYEPLSKQERLIIPGQVAREFAKNRASKLADLYHLIAQKQIPSMQKGKYPLLSNIDVYKDVVQIEEEIDQSLQEYREKYKKAVRKVLNSIEEWEWNDPVSQLYSDLFVSNAIVDPSIDLDQIRKDLETRQQHNIPPGYKDRGKSDKGIGDLLIWHTILEIGKTKKQSVIFVSGDEKSDWYQRSEGKALYPRYELIDEFRRFSDGQAFYIIKFSRFLELFGASEKVVEEVRQEESTNTSKPIDQALQTYRFLHKHLLDASKKQNHLYQTLLSTWFQSSEVNPPTSTLNYADAKILLDILSALESYEDPEIIKFISKRPHILSRITEILADADDQERDRIIKSVEERMKRRYDQQSESFSRSERREDEIDETLEA